MALTSDSQEELLERLGDPEYAAGYLSACAAEGQDEFLLGLRNVTKALCGVGQLAATTELNRQGLYDMLSEEENPRLSSLFAVLKAIAMQFNCIPTQSSPSR